MLHGWVVGRITHVTPRGVDPQIFGVDVIGGEIENHLSRYGRQTCRRCGVRAALPVHPTFENPTDAGPAGSSR